MSYFWTEMCWQTTVTLSSIFHGKWNLMKLKRLMNSHTLNWSENFKLGFLNFCLYLQKPLSNISMQLTSLQHVLQKICGSELEWCKTTTRFEVLKTVFREIPVLWNKIFCSLVEKYWYVGCALWNMMLCNLARVPTLQMKCIQFQVSPK